MIGLFGDDAPDSGFEPFFLEGQFVFEAHDLRLQMDCDNGLRVVKCASRGA